MTAEQQPQVGFQHYGLNRPNRYVHMLRTNICMVRFYHVAIYGDVGYVQIRSPRLDVFDTELWKEPRNVQTNLSVLMSALHLSFLEVTAKNWQHITNPKDLSGRSQHTKFKFLQHHNATCWTLRQTNVPHANLQSQAHKKSFARFSHPGIGSLDQIVICKCKICCYPSTRNIAKSSHNGKNPSHKTMPAYIITHWSHR